jgi:sodium transport system permease protein
MRSVWIVLRKELTDAFRDWRMVIVAFCVMPLAVPAVLAGVSSFAVRKQAAKLEGPLELPVIGGERAPNLLAWLKSQNVRVLPAPVDADAAVREERHDVVLRISGSFAEDWRASRPARVELIFDSSRPLQSGTTISRTRGLLDAYSGELGSLRLIARGIHPGVASPLQVGQRDVARPEARFDFAQQLVPYLLLLLAFIGGMQVAIDATAGERERQSLEPLLATPASRGAIISGKIIAAAAFALASISVTLLAYRVAFSLLPAESIDVSLDIPPGALLRLFALILPIILLGATVLTALAAFARSYREAQGYLPLLIFLPMVPSLLLMVAPVRTQPWMLAVPFMSQYQLILRPLRGEAIAGWEWAVSLGSGFALAALAWFIAARLYHRERLAISG